jgi:hypothetical protein
MLNTPNGAEPLQAQVQVTMEDVVEGFRDLEKDINSKPSISFPRPLGENEMQECSDGMILQPAKKAKLSPAADLLPSE